MPQKRRFIFYVMRLYVKSLWKPEQFKSVYKWFHRLIDIWIFKVVKLNRMSYFIAQNETNTLYSAYSYYQSSMKKIHRVWLIPLFRLSNHQKFSFMLTFHMFWYMLYFESVLGFFHIFHWSALYSSESSMLN